MVKPVSVAFVLFALATAARAEPLPVPMPDRAAGPTRMASRIQAASACLPRAPRMRFLSATAAARTGGLPAVRSVSEAGGDSMSDSVQKITFARCAPPACAACWSTIAAAIRRASMPIDGRITFGCPT